MTGNSTATTWWWARIWTTWEAGLRFSRRGRQRQRLGHAPGSGARHGPDEGAATPNGGVRLVRRRRDGPAGREAVRPAPAGGLERCLAVFNMDMVGVGTGAYVAGGKNFPEVFKALEEARDRVEPGIKLVAGESSGEARADHGPSKNSASTP